MDPVSAVCPVTLTLFGLVSKRIHSDWLFTQANQCMRREIIKEKGKP